MKTLLFCLLFLTSTGTVVAQSVKLVQHCILEAKYKPKHKAYLTLLTGADSTATGQVAEVNKVAGMTYEVDALNYLSTRGWEIISTTTLTGATGVSYATRYYLRRKL